MRDFKQSRRLDRAADRPFLETDRPVLVLNTKYASICRKVTTDWPSIILISSTDWTFNKTSLPSVLTAPFTYSCVFHWQDCIFKGSNIAICDCYFRVSINLGTNLNLGRCDNVRNFYRLWLRILIIACRNDPKFSDR